MPGKQRLRRDDGCDLGQEFPSQSFGACRQAPTLIVVEPEPPSPELFPQDLVLFAKVIDHLNVPLVHPAGQGHQDESKRVDELEHASKAHCRLGVHL